MYTNTHHHHLLLQHPSSLQQLLPAQVAELLLGPSDNQTWLDNQPLLHDVPMKTIENPTYIYVLPTKTSSLIDICRGFPIATTDSQRITIAEWKVPGQLG